MTSNAWLPGGTSLTVNRPSARGKPIRCRPPSRVTTTCELCTVLFMGKCTPADAVSSAGREGEFLCRKRGGGSQCETCAAEGLYGSGAKTVPSTGKVAVLPAARVHETAHTADSRNELRLSIIMLRACTALLLGSIARHLREELIQFTRSTPLESCMKTLVSPHEGTLVMFGGTALAQHRCSCL